MSAKQAETLKTARAHDDWDSGNMTTSSDNEVYLLTETAKDSGLISKNPGGSPLMTTEQMKCDFNTADGTQDSGEGAVDAQSRWWWLRSPANHAARVSDIEAGTGNLTNCNHLFKLGIRPAVTIKLK